MSEQITVDLSDMYIEGIEMRSKMQIKVDFLAGTKIEDAIAEAKIMAEKLDVAYITFDFNGTNVSIGRNCDVEETVRLWDKDRKYGICAP